MLRYPNLRVGDRVQVKLNSSYEFYDGRVIHVETSTWYVEVRVLNCIVSIKEEDELLPPTLTQLLTAFSSDPSNERLRGQLISAFKYGDI